VVINLCVFQNKISLRICMQHILKLICIQDFFFRMSMVKLI
jgi:hypothetical protein